MRLILCLITGFLYLIIYPGYASGSKDVNKACSTKCATPFGTVLGEGDGVFGYSNCHPDCENDQWNSITLKGQSVQTGMKWQCVEYARRWLNLKLGYTFASIDHAYQIWDLEIAQQLNSQKTVSWSKFANHKTKEKPKRNDILIYNTKQGVHGHVSVIAGVKEGFVWIAEQNYSNAVWEQPNYARKVPLIKDKKGHYRIKDLGVIGWMRIGPA